MANKTRKTNLITITFPRIKDKKKELQLNCPQKVRHYLGAVLWKEKSNTIMNLNFVV
jgi:hypothetical protein